MPVIAQRCAENTCLQPCEKCLLEDEILDRGAALGERAMQARLMAFEPGHQLFVRIDRVERMQRRIGDEADRMRPRRERNQPCPVARTAQVIGRAPAFARIAARIPFVVVAEPVVHPDALGDAEPDRVRIVGVRLGQVELALEQAAPAAGIDQPARAGGLQRTVVAVTHFVRTVILGAIDAMHAGAVDEIDAERAACFAMKFSRMPRSSCQLGVGNTRG